MTSTAQAYLALPADERFETRISTMLKRHAETVAKARGESLSEYVLELLAEKVAMDIVATQEPAGQEVRGLPTVELGGLQTITRAERNLDHVARIPIEVAERDCQCPVPIVVPPLEPRDHGIPAPRQRTVEPLHGLLRLLGSERLAERAEGGRHEDRAAQARTKLHVTLLHERVELLTI